MEKNGWKACISVSAQVSTHAELCTSWWWEEALTQPQAIELIDNNKVIPVYTSDPLGRKALALLGILALQGFNLI